MSTQIPYIDAQVNLDQLCDRVAETGEAVHIKSSLTLDRAINRIALDS